MDLSATFSAAHDSKSLVRHDTSGRALWRAQRQALEAQKRRSTRWGMRHPSAVPEIVNLAEPLLQFFGWPTEELKQRLREVNDLGYCRRVTHAPAGRAPFLCLKRLALRTPQGAAARVMPDEALGVVCCGECRREVHGLIFLPKL